MSLLPSWFVGAAISALVCTASQLPLCAQGSRYVAGIETTQDAAGSAVEVPWKLLMPQKMEADQRYPLVLFLHGAGERGNDNEKQLKWFSSPMAEVARSEKFPCFVLAPQCPQDRRWVEVDWSAAASSRPSVPPPAMEGAIAALRHVIAKHPIDLDRIYLTGLSMGGFGTWDLASRHPTWFAAAAPICGGGDPLDAPTLATLPIWCFHGDQDRAVSVERSRAMIQAIEAAGGTPIYSELAGVGHDSWKQAYAEEGGCLDWLFASRKGQSERTALATAAWRTGDRVAFLGDSITQAGAAPGGYISLLAESLQERKGEEAVPFLRAGISGNKIGDLLGRYERDVLAEKPTLVFVYIGINDVWHQKLNGKGTPIKDFAAGMRELTTKLRSGGATIVLATPSVIGEKANGANELDADLDRYAEITRQLAAEEGFVLCDLRRDFTDYLALRNPDDRERGVLTSDGVHLNAAGNAFVAERVAAALHCALKQRGR